MTRNTDQNHAFKFSTLLLAWFDCHGRHDLPWQHPRTPYRVWLSEIMLQQTQVNTVIPYFNKFVEAFPDVKSLAEATPDDVLKHWAGLGYYARARNLHKTARTLMSASNGEFPPDSTQLQALPGIGRSTAGAILAQGFSQRATVLDGNVKRVLTRYEGISGWPGNTETEKKLWSVAGRYTPQERIVDYTQAIMDLGATICKRNKPQCTVCPLMNNCQAQLTSRTAELPTRKPKKQIPTVERYILVKVSATAEVYLERRGDSGIWGGLFSFPESLKDCRLEAALTEFRSRYQLPLTNYRTAAPVRHTFSHYHLILKPIISQLQKPNLIQEESGLWLKPPATQVGLPAPIEKWLSNPDNTQTLLL